MLSSVEGIAHTCATCVVTEAIVARTVTRDVDFSNWGECEGLYSSKKVLLKVHT